MLIECRLRVQDACMARMAEVLTVSTSTTSFEMI